MVSGNDLFTKDELIDKFGWEEYFVFALMLAVSAAIGIFFMIKGQKDNATFLLGGKSMGIFPMTLSLVARYFLTKLLHIKHLMFFFQFHVSYYPTGHSCRNIHLWHPIYCFGSVLSICHGFCGLYVSPSIFKTLCFNKL